MRMVERMPLTSIEPNFQIICIDIEKLKHWTIHIIALKNLKLEDKVTSQNAARFKKIVSKMMR